MPKSGYVHCACRDCFEIAIAGTENEPAFCFYCKHAQCEGDSECRSDSAYGCDEASDEA